MEAPYTHQEIACQQVLVDDASVFSIQWSVFPSAIVEGFSPEKLIERYLVYIKSCTLSVIRPHISKNGLEFNVMGTGWSLISFFPPQFENDFVTLGISGGLLVQPRRRDKGRFRFGLEKVPGGVCVSLRLSEFRPLVLGGSSPSRIRFWLYRLTHATIHRLATVRFLILLYRELSGIKTAVRVVKANVCDGQPV